MIKSFLYGFSPSVLRLMYFTEKHLATGKYQDVMEFVLNPELWESWHDALDSAAEARYLIQIGRIISQSKNQELMDNFQKCFPELKLDADLPAESIPIDSTLTQAPLLEEADLPSDPVEQALLVDIEKSSKINMELHARVLELLSHFLPSVSKNFLLSKVFISYVAQSSLEIKLLHWSNLYAIQKSTYYLERIDDTLKTEVERSKQSKASGVGSLDAELFSRRMIRAIYQSEDHALIGVFQKHLPIPKAELFQEKIPGPVILQQKEGDEAIQEFLSRNNPDNKKNNLELLMTKIISIQRLARSKIRHSEEVQRIKHFYQAHSNEVLAEQVIADASKPYIPKCSDRALQSVFLKRRKK
ncbi:MAG: hypothetical protein ACRCXC_12115 [Legionella sp.]